MRKNDTCASHALSEATLDRIARMAGISPAAVIRVLEMKATQHRAEIRENAKRLLAHAAAAYAAERELVYFLQAEGSGRIKIGTTRDLGQRLRALRAGSPVRLELLGVVRGGRPMEQLLHIAFAPLRCGRSEWFEPSDGLLSCVRELKKSEVKR